MQRAGWSPGTASKVEPDLEARREAEVRPVWRNLREKPPSAPLPLHPGGAGRLGPPRALPRELAPPRPQCPRALPVAPGAANPHFPRAGLSSGQRNQPSQARRRPAEPAGPPRPLDPRQRGWAWAPPATAPPTRTPEEREPHPRRRRRPYLQGTARLLDSGCGPEGRRRGGPEPVPQGP